MNRVRLRFFATLRERARVAELDRYFPDGATVTDIWKALKREFPALESYRDAVGFAANEEYVEGGYRPHHNDQIAFIPPVSGGVATPEESLPWVGSISVVRPPIDVAELEREVASPAAGAIVTFTGTTRIENAGRRAASSDIIAPRFAPSVSSGNLRIRRGPK
jgi:molybdopterin synthase catalytic subunit